MLFLSGCSASNEEKASDCLTDQWFIEDSINTDLGIEGEFGGIVFGDSLYNTYLSLKNDSTYPLFTLEYFDGIHHSPFFWIDAPPPNNVFGITYDYVLVSGLNQNIYGAYFRFNDSDSTKYGSLVKELTKEFGAIDSSHAEEGLYYREWNNDLAKVEFRNIDNWGTSLIYQNRTGLDLRRSYMDSLKQAYQQTEYQKTHIGKVDLFTTTNEFFKLNKGELFQDDGPFGSFSLYYLDYVSTMKNMRIEGVDTIYFDADITATFDSSTDSLYNFGINFHPRDDGITDRIINDILGERYKTPDLTVIKNVPDIDMMNKLDYYYFKDLLVIVENETVLDTSLKFMPNAPIDLHIFSNLGF